jgi:hypothetical protein
VTVSYLIQLSKFEKIIGFSLIYCALLFNSLLNLSPAKFVSTKKRSGFLEREWTYLSFGSFKNQMLSNIYFWPRFIFAYQKSLKRTLKTGFWVQNHLFNLSSSAVNSQRLFKKLVWMFVLMLSGIQIGFPFSLFLIKTVSFLHLTKTLKLRNLAFFFLAYSNMNYYDKNVYECLHDENKNIGLRGH